MNEKPLDEKAADEWHERKDQLMSDILGPEHNMVSHSLIPFALGGALDLFYYPNGIPGTAIATKELSEVEGEGSTNDIFINYELVMFTRHPITPTEPFAVNIEDDTPYGRDHENISAILNCMALYSQQATLNPTQTCEFPAEMEGLGGLCLIFDAYGQQETSTENSSGWLHLLRGGKRHSKEKFGLLLLMNIHREELKFAQAQGSGALLEKLKQAGYYPYFATERPSVV